MQTFTRLFKPAFLLRAPGLVQAWSVDPVSVDGVPNVLNLYLKPHFMASVLADLGLIPSNWAEHIWKYLEIGPTSDWAPCQTSSSLTCIIRWPVRQRLVKSDVLRKDQYRSICRATVSSRGSTAPPSDLCEACRHRAIEPHHGSRFAEHFNFRFLWDFWRSADCLLCLDCLITKQQCGRINFLPDYSLGNYTPAAGGWKLKPVSAGNPVSSEGPLGIKLPPGLFL